MRKAFISLLIPLLALALSLSSVPRCGVALAKWLEPQGSMVSCHEVETADTGHHAAYKGPDMCRCVADLFVLSMPAPLQVEAHISFVPKLLHIIHFPEAGHLLAGMTRTPSPPPRA